jgi:hypothetical protein
MSITTIAATEDIHAERWRQWEQASAASSRRGAARARIVIGVTLTALGGWLGLQLLSSPFWS